MAIGLKVDSLLETGTLVSVSVDVMSHAHLVVTPEETVGVGSEVAFFWHGQETDSFLCGEIIAFYDASSDRKGILFTLKEKVVPRSKIAGTNMRDWVSYVTDAD